MKIRKAEIKDAKEIAEVKNWSLDHQEFIGKKRKRWIFVCCWRQKKGVIGYIIGGRESEQESEFDCEIHAIYILKEFQRKGIGSLFFEKAVEDFFNLGLKYLKIWVLKNNLYQKFYERLGGKQVGTKKFRGLDLIAYG